MLAVTDIKGPEAFDEARHNIFALDDDYQRFAHESIHDRAGSFAQLPGHVERVFALASPDIISTQKEHVIAYIHAHEKDDALHIDLLATDTAYENMGLARSLIRAAFEDVTGLVEKPLNAIVVPSALANDFYTKLGFDGARGSIMRLPLSTANLQKVQAWRPHVRPGLRLVTPAGMGHG